MNAQLPLFETRHAGQNYLWQWHGRQMFSEVRNDFGCSRRLHRVVYYLADTCEAPDEATAIAIFKVGYPEAQTTGLFCVGLVKQCKGKP